MRVDQAEIRSITEQATAVLRVTVAREELARWLPEAFGRVAAYLHHRGVAPRGFPFARYHVRPDGRLDVEAGFPVAAPLPGETLATAGPPLPGGSAVGDAVVRPGTLPGGYAVAAWHAGPAEKLELAYRAIDDWLQTEAAERSGDPWEVFHDPPTANPSHCHTEVVQPIRCRH